MSVRTVTRENTKHKIEREGGMVVEENMEEPGGEKKKKFKWLPLHQKFKSRAHRCNWLTILLLQFLLKNHPSIITCIHYMKVPSDH